MYKKSSDGNWIEPELNTLNLNPIFGLSEPNKPNVISWPNRTELSGYSNRTLWQGFDSRCSVACTVYSADKPAMFLSVWVFYLSVLIVKDHQAVEPNAKYTYTAKQFYATDILKPNRTSTTVSVESNLDKTPTQPEPWPWLNQTETELLLLGSIPITKKVKCAIPHWSMRVVLISLRPWARRW